MVKFWAGQSTAIYGDGSNGVVPNSTVSFDGKASQAREALHDILRAKRDNKTVPDLVGEKAAKDAGAMAGSSFVDDFNSAKAKAGEVEKREQESRDKFAANASSLAKSAASGFTSWNNDRKKRKSEAAKIEEGRAKASTMFKDLKASGLTTEDAIGKTIASLKFDGYSNDQIREMIDASEGGTQKVRQGDGKRTKSDAAAREELMDVKIDEVKNTGRSEYGKQLDFRAREEEKKQEKNKRVQQKKNEAQQKREADSLLMQTAIGLAGVPYIPGTSDPKQRADNKKVRAEYHKLRKQAREADQNQTKAKAKADAKSQVDSSNVINGTNSGGSGGSGGSVVGNMLVGFGKMLGGGGAAPAPAAAPAAPAGDDLGVIDEEFLPQIDRDNLSFKQKKRYSGKQIDFINNKNRAMFDLYNQGWAAKDEKEKKKALYAVDSGYRQAAGTRSENWYLGVANQQIMAFGKQLEQQQASTRQARGFAEGGMNGGMDTIPAMLTPGEFVMSREAVAKHGVGYMKNLNMGKATGFRRGGVVGTGNVQYKADGGSVDGNGGMMIDPSLLSGALDAFSQDFSAIIDKITGPMANLAASLENIANAFSGLTMTHVFSGEIGLAVNVSNKDAIIAAVSEGITPMISQLITRQLNAQENNFKAGG